MIAKIDCRNVGPFCKKIGSKTLPKRSKMLPRRPKMPQDVARTPVIGQLVLFWLHF